MYAQSQNWCSKHVHVYEYMYIAKNFCHEGATVSPFYLLLCSYLATTVRSAPVVTLHTCNVTLSIAHYRRLPQKTKWIIFLKIKTPSNSDETGPGERTREGDNCFKV